MLIKLEIDDEELKEALENFKGTAQWKKVILNAQNRNEIIDNKKL